MLFLLFVIEVKGKLLLLSKNIFDIDVYGLPNSRLRRGLSNKDRGLTQQRKELKSYEEERSFIQRFILLLSASFFISNYSKGLTSSFRGQPKMINFASRKYQT